jgi:hypothetical protein
MSGLLHHSKEHLYSITSSARPRSVGGTSRPSVLAVFKLRTSSNLVGCRQIGGLLAAQDAIDERGSLPVLLGQIDPIGNQAAVRDEVPECVSRWQAVPGSKRDDQLAINFGDRAWQHDQTGVWLASELTDGALHPGDIAHASSRQLHAERGRGRFDGAPHPQLRRLVGVGK